LTTTDDVEAVVADILLAVEIAAIVAVTAAAATLTSVEDEDCKD